MDMELFASETTVLYIQNLKEYESCVRDSLQSYLSLIRESGKWSGITKENSNQDDRIGIGTLSRHYAFYSDDISSIRYQNLATFWVFTGEAYL